MHIFLQKVHVKNLFKQTHFFNAGCRSPLSPWLFSSRFWSFLSDGSSKTPHKKYKTIVSKSFLKKSTKKTGFARFCFCFIAFSGFLGEGSPKTPKEYTNKIAPVTFLVSDLPTYHESPRYSTFLGARPLGPWWSVRAVWVVGGTFFGLVLAPLAQSATAITFPPLSCPASPCYCSRPLAVPLTTDSTGS